MLRAYEKSSYSVGKFISEMNYRAFFACDDSTLISSVSFILIASRYEKLTPRSWQSELVLYDCLAGRCDRKKSRLISRLASHSLLFLRASPGEIASLETGLRLASPYVLPYYVYRVIGIVTQRLKPKVL